MTDRLRARQPSAAAHRVLPVSTRGSSCGGANPMWSGGRPTCSAQQRQSEQNKRARELGLRGGPPPGTLLGGTVYRARFRARFVAAALGLLAFALAAALPRQAAAFQDEGGQAAADQGAAEQEPPAEGAAPADAEATPEGQAPQSESFLMWMISASGVFGLVLLLLSFIMVALIAMNILQVRRDVLMPPSFIEEFEHRLADKDLQGAYDTARNDDSFLGRVLAGGLRKINRGYDEAIEGMQEVGEDENMALEHRLSYLALIGSISPMIGLMGTVYGMITSFQTIANSPVQPRPAELAGGISTALFTTLEGLTVAIPAMIFYSLLRNRVSRFVLEVGMISEGLLSRVFAAGKPPTSRAGGGSTVSAAPSAAKD